MLKDQTLKKTGTLSLILDELCKVSAENRRFLTESSQVSEDAIGGCGKKRGEENLTKDTPQKERKGFRPPPVIWCVFEPPQVSLL